MPVLAEIVAALLLLCAVFEGGLSQESSDDIVTTKKTLKKLLAGEINKALDDFTCSVPESTPVPCPDHAPSLDRIEETMGRIEDTLASPSTVPPPPPSLNRIEETMGKIEDMVTALNQRMESLQREVNLLHDEYGRTKTRAANSCTDILAGRANSPSGYYWVKNATGHPHSVYCDMTRSCGGVTGGWMRVAYLDMTNTSHQCPSGLRQNTFYNNKIACTPQAYSATCSSVWYPSHGIEYSRVCGSIQGYQSETLDGFNDYGRGTNLTLDSNYVDGVSLTHGMPPRHHIWTFAGKNPECNFGLPPAFINNDYFCDRTYSYDLLLWNNKCNDCTCCSVNNPPWFHKHLPHPTTDSIEMRLCRDQDRTDEDVAVAKVEIYVL